MPNNNVAILSIMSKFDEKSAREAAKRADKVYEEALSDIGNVNFDKKLIENFDKAMNLLKNKFKKVNLSSYTNSLLDSIFSDKDIKEKSKDIELFISKIEMLKKASSGQDINAFNTFSAKQIDALISRTEKLAQKQEEINEKTREYNREATKIAKTNRSISTIDKNYGNQDYSKTLESLKKSLGVEKEFTAEQNQSIENLAKMVNLYQLMERSEPQNGTAEAIRYSKDLLAVTQKIKEERDKIDAFSQKGASTYIANNGLSSIDKVSDYTVSKSKEDFVKASLSNLKSQEAKLQSELTTYISESVQKNLAKVSKEVDAVIDKAEKRVENLQNKIESLQTKSTKTGSDNSIASGIVSETDIKSLEEIEDRLYAISDLDAEGEATKQQLKEYIQLYKQYEQLVASDSTVKFDPGLKEEYDFIVESDSKLKKYADTLDETISKQKELNAVKSNENEVSVDTQTKQLVKQEEQIKETIQAEKQLQDTQEKVSSNTKISVDAEQAIADINKIKESLNSIPEEKKIKITISDSDYTNTPLLSDAEGNTITAFRGVVGAWSGLINQDGIGFFTDKLKLAADYADSLAESGKVYQANLSFKNPLEVEGNGAKWDEIDFNGVKKTTDEIVELAKQLGHDGVIFKNIRDGFTDTEEDISNVMVALNAAQIKNEQVIGTVKAGTGEMVGVASKINNATDTATNSIVESQNKIQEELKETQKVAEQVSEAMSNVSSDKSNISSENQIRTEQELNNEIERRESILRELYDLQSKLTVGEDFHGNDRYFADALPSEDDIRKADARIKELTGSNNIFDVNQLIEDRNRWLNEVKYSLEEYDNLIKQNNQKAIDDYASQGLSRIDGAESFFGFEDNYNSIASKFAEQREKISLEIGKLYEELDNIPNLQIKDVIQGDTEKSGMDEVASATEEAVQVKKDFATANEGVQSSVDDSKSKLELEAELMNQIAKSAREAADAKKEFVDANKEVKDSTDNSTDVLKKNSNKQIETIQKKIFGYDNQYKVFNNRNNKTDEYKFKIEEYKQAIDELQNKINYFNNNGGIKTKEDLNELNRLKDVVEQLDKSIKTMSSSEKGSSQSGINTLFMQLYELKNKYQGMTKEQKAMVNSLEAEWKQLGNSLNLENAKAQLRGLQAELERTDTATKTLWGAFKEKVFYRTAAQFASMFGIYDIINYLKQGTETVKEYDDGLTKMSYTMDMTKKQFDDLGKSILNMASNMRTSLDDAMQVAQIYANMNTTAEEINRLSQPTLILSNLTGFDAETVANDIQAVTQQFEIAAEDSMHIADVYDYISRSISVDYSKGIEGMAEAVQVAGSTAKQAGLEFEQLTAIVAKAQEKTRLEGSQIGNGIKTLMTRLSKVGELSDEVDNETMSQASESLHQIGIEVYNLDGSYRKFDVIMTELANKWESLSDAEKANISFAIAATRQTNLLSAILSNFTDSMQLAEEATNANGSALENQNKYMDSFSGHLQALETEAKIAWINILDSETLKGGIDLLTSLVKILGELIDKIGVIGTIGIGTGLFAGIKNVGRLKMHSLIVLNCRQQYVFFGILKFSYCQM